MPHRYDPMPSWCDWFHPRSSSKSAMWLDSFVWKTVKQKEIKNFCQRFLQNVCKLWLFKVTSWILFLDCKITFLLYVWHLEVFRAVIWRKDFMFKNMQTLRYYRGTSHRLTLLLNSYVSGTHHWFIRAVVHRIQLVFLQKIFFKYISPCLLTITFYHLVDVKYHLQKL